MKKYILFLFATNALFASFGQSERPKEIHLRSGIGISAYNTTTNLNYDIVGLNIVDSNSGQAGTVHVPVELRVELTRRINLGLDARFGSYLYDPAVNESGEKNNNFWVLGPAAEFNFVGRDHFRWYGGVGLHFAKLNTYEVFNTDPIPFFGVLTAKNSMTWTGLGTSVNTGFLWFIAGGPVALNCNIGYDGVNFDLKEFKSELPIIGPQTIIGTGSLNATGIKIDAGLVFRLKRG